MSKNIFKAAMTLLLCCVVSGVSYSQDYKRINGTYYNNAPSTVTCNCQAPGLLSYVASDGNTYTMILCFDTEPGSFYEIFNSEIITVEGVVKNTACQDGQYYSVLYVEKSQMQSMSRRELVPEFLKQNGGNFDPSPSNKSTPSKGSAPKNSTPSKGGAPSNGGMIMQTKQ